MKYIPQFLIIIVLSFIGEVLHYVIPFPIPASIYGMILMFLVLSFKVIKLEQVKDAGEFLVSILPVLFVAPIVSLIDSLEHIRGKILPILIILVVSTVICFAVSGKTTELFMHREKGGNK